MNKQKFFIIIDRLRLHKLCKVMRVAKFVFRRSYWSLWHFALLLIICPACISFKISPDTQKSQSVSYQEPSSPFVVTDSASADRAWMDPDTGSTISYQSICNESIDPDLETILQKSTSELLDKKILKRTRMQYNGRRAERVLVSGQIDGVIVNLEFVFFKKNACSYTLTFTSLPEHFKKSADIFNNFIDGFKVQ